jgi:ribonuclease P protein component
VSQCFSRTNRLVKSSEFLQVRKRGCSIKTAPFWIQCLLESDGNSKIGIIVTKRLGNAVLRNRAKRMIRECFRSEIDQISQSIRVVVLPKKHIFKTPFSELKSLFIDSLNEALNRT